MFIVLQQPWTLECPSLVDELGDMAALSGSSGSLHLMVNLLVQHQEFIILLLWTVQ